MAPPTLHIIRTLAAHANNLEKLPAALTAIPEAQHGMVRRIEFRPGIFLFPVRTPTLPPATHTNCLHNRRRRADRHRSSLALRGRTKGTGCIHRRNDSRGFIEFER